MNNDYRLIVGDANQIIDRLIKEKVKVDCIYTSPNPPFYTKDNPDKDEQTMENNIGSEKTFQEYMDNLFTVFEKSRAILTDMGSLWVHMGDYFMINKSKSQVPQRFALTMVDKYKWILKSTLIWFRPEIGELRNETRFRQDYEFIYWFTKCHDVVAYDTQYLDSSIIEAPYILPPEGSWESGYPERIIEIPLITTTMKGMNILDMFMGTGTTGIVARRLGRKFIGIELFPDKLSRTAARFLNR